MQIVTGPGGALFVMTMGATLGIVNPRQEQEFNGLSRASTLTIANYKINLVQLIFSLSPNSTTYLNSPNVFSQITNDKIELILFINSVPRRKMQQVKSLRCRFPIHNFFASGVFP